MSLQSGTLSKGSLFWFYISICYVSYVSSGDKIQSCHTRKKYEVLDIGILHPEEVSTSNLQVGQVGYIGKACILVVSQKF